MADRFDKLTTGFKNLIYEKKGRIAYVTINRPERMNAIDGDTSRELRQAFSDFRDDDQAWVSILTGAGERAFSAGADLVEMSQGFAAGGLPVDVAFGGITRGIEIGKPIIAAINGYCLAGGLELALCCDIRVAAEHAVFGLPEPTRAIIPGAGGTQRLPRAVPLAFAMELLLTGGRFDAQTALRFGLVSHVVPAAELMPTAEAHRRQDPGVRPAGGAGHQAGGLSGAGHDPGGGPLPGGRALRRRVANRGRPRGAHRLRPEAQAGVQGALSPLLRDESRSFLKAEGFNPPGGDPIVRSEAHREQRAGLGCGSSLLRRDASER